MDSRHIWNAKYFTLSSYTIKKFDFSFFFLVQRLGGEDSNSSPLYQRHVTIIVELSLCWQEGLSLSLLWIWNVRGEEWKGIFWLIIECVEEKWKWCIKLWKEREWGNCGKTEKNKKKRVCGGFCEHNLSAHTSTSRSSWWGWINFMLVNHHFCLYSTIKNNCNWMTP